MKLLLSLLTACFLISCTNYKFTAGNKYKGHFFYTGHGVTKPLVIDTLWTPKIRKCGKDSIANL